MMIYYVKVQSFYHFDSYFLRKLAFPR